LQGTAGPHVTRQRLLVGGLLVVALLLAVSATTIASRPHKAEAAPEPSRRATVAGADPLSSTTTAAPTTTTGAPTTSSTAAVHAATPPASAAVAADAPDDAGDGSTLEGNGAPTSPPPPPKGDCGGQALTKPDGSAWTCSFDDEFDGSALDTSLWMVQETSWNGYHVGSECFVDTPNNVALGDGALHLTVRKETQGFVCHRPKKPYNTQWTGGMVTTYGKYTQAFGRFEIRAKFPAGAARGLHSAFWMWPQDPDRYGRWPGSGEIDIAEYYSQWSDRVVPYVHYTGSQYQVTNQNCLVADPSAWHTYDLYWTHTAISMTIDGRDCLYTKINPLFPMQAPAPFDQPFELSLTQGLGVKGNAPSSATALPATTAVDYVRMWK
jgi:beta-glucanase (GH16 family)